MVRIALCALRGTRTVEGGAEKVVAALGECADRGAQLACFPEAYLPGLRGADFDLPPPDQPALERALAHIQTVCKQTGVAAIVGMEWQSDLGLENRAVVISARGRVLGHQTKNQITPGGESRWYVPDGKRRVFTVAGLTFGIVICHEGWRYPETVRWAAVRGARIVFQPQVTGSDTSGTMLTQWGEHFYEKAMLCRAAENTIWFASVNQAMRYQNSATSLVDPDAKLVDWIPYGEERILVADIAPARATRWLAKRYRPELYPA